MQRHLHPQIVSEYDQEYHNHKPQTTPWHREEEPLNHYETPGRPSRHSGGGGGGGGGTLILSSNVGLGPASTVYPPKYQKYQLPPQKIQIFAPPK